VAMVSKSPIPWVPGIGKTPSSVGVAGGGVEAGILQAVTPKANNKRRATRSKCFVFIFLLLTRLSLPVRQGLSGDIGLFC
jgi:hypothetical protein